MRPWLALALAACPHPEEPATPAAQAATPVETATAFLTDYEARVAPLERSLSLAYWDATTTGDASHYDDVTRIELELRAQHTDAEDFATLTTLREADLGDPLLERQVDRVWAAYAENQIDRDLMERMVALSTQISQTYNTFRGEIDGEPVDSNTIMEILGTETDMARRQAAWEASKQVGPAVADDLRELVRVRNQAAQQLGFPDYYQMRLTLGEQDPADVQRLFAEMDEVTDAPFAELKASLDATLRQRYGTDGPMVPWMYSDPFFQEVPRLTDTDLDQFYADADLSEVTARYYASIGMDVQPVMEASDLFPRDGKQPAAFCTNIDRSGDIRVLANIAPNEYWMSTMLHEFGHAVYDEYVDPDLPWILRTPAHEFTTEAVAMLFGRLSKDPAWISTTLGVPADELAPYAADMENTQRALQLVFARWSLVMADFERSMYADPEQDLQDLWWTLVEEHQGVTRPEGREDAADWATKIHLVSAPAYYHNYLLGEMMASQVSAAIARDLGTEHLDSPEVGAWLSERVFAPGARYSWDDMIARATGEPLTPRFFVEEYVTGAAPAE